MVAWAVQRSAVELRHRRMSAAFCAGRMHSAHSSRPIGITRASEATSTGHMAARDGETAGPKRLRLHSGAHSPPNDLPEELGDAADDAGSASMAVACWGGRVGVAWFDSDMCEVRAVFRGRT